MNSTKLLLYSRRLRKWRCHRETKRLRKSSGWNRLRRGYGGSSVLLEYAVMHDDEAEAVGRATPSRWSRVQASPSGGAAQRAGRAQAFYPRSTALQIISFAPLSGGAN